MGSAAVQTAKDIYAKHAPIEVSDSLLDDLVLLYASESLPEDETEAFVERMAEDNYKASIRLDFCHCCMAVNGAMYIDDDEVFRSFVNLLELEEEDEVLAKMKRFIVRKLADDALDAVEDVASFQARVEVAERAV